MAEPSALADLLAKANRALLRLEDLSRSGENSSALTVDAMNVYFQLLSFRDSRSGADAAQLQSVIDRLRAGLREF
jgi:hypothetical protein